MVAFCYFHRSRLSVFHYHTIINLSYRRIVMEILTFDRSKNPVIFFPFLQRGIWHALMNTRAARDCTGDQAGSRVTLPGVCGLTDGYRRFLDRPGQFHLPLLIVSALSLLRLRVGFVASSTRDHFDPPTMEKWAIAVGSSMSIESVPDEGTRNLLAKTPPGTSPGRPIPT